MGPWEQHVHFFLKENECPAQCHVTAKYKHTDYLEPVAIPHDATITMYKG